MIDYCLARINIMCAQTRLISMKIVFVTLICLTAVIAISFSLLELGTAKWSLLLLRTTPDLRDNDKSTAAVIDIRGISLVNDDHDSVVVSEIKALTQECMTRSNFQPLVRQAQRNALYYYNEFRKAIPSNPLSGYSSHCWKMNYSVHWRNNVCSGVLGNITYEADYCRYRPYFNGIIPYMKKIYPGGEYKSNLVCIPNVFIAGFAKSGTTFLYNFVHNLISISLKDDGVRQVGKEPQLWVRFHAHLQESIHPLQEGVLGGYLLNFVPGTEKIAKVNRTNLPLVDGTTNTVFEFPRFNKTENNLTNYCILPVVLPRLLPDSKYLVVMRNPVSMLYSMFWFSCSLQQVSLNSAMRKKGPDVFHHQVVLETGSFNNCMRNISEPSIREECKMEDKDEYASCIRQRLHLLDKCSAKITYSLFSKEMPQCGEVRLYGGIYYVHLKKWIDLVSRDRLLLFTLEEMKTDAIRVASDIVQGIGLDPSIVTEENIQNAERVSSKNKQTYRNDPSMKMRDDTVSILEIFYHPFNSLLAELLDDDKFNWF